MNYVNHLIVEVCLFLVGLKTHQKRYKISNHLLILDFYTIYDQFAFLTSHRFYLRALTAILNPSFISVTLIVKILLPKRRLKR